MCAQNIPKGFRFRGWVPSLFLLPPAGQINQSLQALGSVSARFLRMEGYEWRRQPPEARVRGGQVFWAGGLKAWRAGDRTEFSEAGTDGLSLRLSGREAHVSMSGLAEGRVETKAHVSLIWV